MNNKKVKTQKKKQKPTKSKTKSKTKQKIILNLIVPNEKIQYINVNTRKPRGPDKKPRTRGPNKKNNNNTDDEYEDNINSN